ncbi:MAG: Sir2 family NAD-dependent protein deacetylase [Planctomycetota bacterium]|jgi:NAD-dependent deacetylase|nr:Sir2 family NAD-dependent protein deacetylase [Planctomycetota bacterium]
MAKSLSPEACADTIRRAGFVSALTGAGISTAAGIPDFRGPKGLYVTRAHDPEKVFEVAAFDHDPEPFYRFSRDFLALVEAVEPTITHRFLARLEENGTLGGIITQNVDGLHRRAGSRNVLAMHGDYSTAHCRRCGREVSGEKLSEGMATETVPHCAECGGVLKPDVVFFGENVRCLVEAESLARRSDLMLVLGSSLTVYPAAAIPYYAGGEVVVVNKGAVGAASGPGVHIVDADLDGYFKAVAEALEM